MAANTTQTQAVLPLDGIRVIEFSHIVMGPACGAVLGDLGADVIRVESLDGGDPSRRAGGVFAYLHRNKRSIAIDLKSSAGLAAAEDLLSSADALLENFAPGTMDRLGLGWDAVHALNPRLVYCALKGFLPGPYDHRASLDELAQFMSGLAYMTGPPGKPLRAGASVVDLMGGVMGAMGIVTALRQRDRDGIGRKIDSALFESAAFLVGQHMAVEAASGTAPAPMPARTRTWGIYETFETRNGEQLFVGITSDNQWRSFCKLFERPDLAADARFASNADRVANRPALHKQVAAILRAHDIETLLRLLDPASIPFAPVRRPSDLFEDPQLNAGGRMLPIRMPNGQIAKLPSLPVCFDAVAPGLRLQPPALGEHTDAVLRALGYDEARIAALRADQAVG